jgi:predicted RNase H-like nuclease
MNFIGVDLAWGPKNRTGLAALDSNGRLVESLSLLTEAEILSFLDRNLPDDGVVAVDAPLVVPNETGQRVAEKLIGRAFGAYGASAHTANRSNPYFCPPRGAVLAERADLDIDPVHRPGPARRTCIEVYPHPAMIAVFGLSYVIPYKQKPGRDLEQLKAAFQRLLELMERHCGPVLRLDDSPRWAEIARVVTGAATKSTLGSVEDEIDAIFCAFLAWMWGTENDRMEVHGDVTTGYMVTPRMSPQAPSPVIPASLDRRDAKREKLRALITSEVPRLSDEEADALVAVILPLTR